MDPTGITCTECDYEFDSDDLYSTGWAYSSDEDTDKTECPSCGHILVVDHYQVKHFRVLTDDEREECL